MQSQKNEFLNLTTFPFDSHISTPLKKKEIPLLLIIEIPTSLIPLLFLAHIPSITTKNRQIPHTKDMHAENDPPYPTSCKEARKNFIQLKTNHCCNHDVRKKLMFCN